MLLSWLLILWCPWPWFSPGVAAWNIFFLTRHLQDHHKAGPHFFLLSSRSRTIAILHSSSSSETNNNGASPSSPSSPSPDAQTDAAASKISRVVQGVTLIRNLVEGVRQHKNSTSTKSSTTQQQQNFPEWMQPLWENLPQQQATRRNNKRYYRRRRWMQNNAALQALTSWAFDQCDAAGDGRINRDELYAGILLVHLHLAKYVGVTACNPLNRTEVDALFDLAAQHDTTNGVGFLAINDQQRQGQTVGRQAFGEIVLLSCAKITSRILVYYALLVVLVPLVTRRLIGVWQQGLHMAVMVAKLGGASGAWRQPQPHDATSKAAAAATAAALTIDNNKSLLVHRHLWALVEWTVQHFLSVLVVTTVMPWIFVQLQSRVPAWMLPRRRYNFSFLSSSSQSSTETKTNSTRQVQDETNTQKKDKHDHE